jgi:uncharacterized protein
MLHGYVEADSYNILAYTARYADQLARAGYLVLHPNLRNFPPSDSGDNPFQTGYVVDTLNLIGVIQRQGGLSGPLEKANPAAVGLWGHSMGGGIALRASVLAPRVQAVVLYAPLSTDSHKHTAHLRFEHSSDQDGRETTIPEADLRRISPLYHLDRIVAPLSIHHGEEDVQVPPAWSIDLCDQLTILRKPVECFIYPDQPHIFWGESDHLFMQRTQDFLDRYLGNR